MANSYIYEGISMNFSDVIHYDVRQCITLFKSNFPIKVISPSLSKNHPNFLLRLIPPTFMKSFNETFRYCSLCCEVVCDTFCFLNRNSRASVFPSKFSCTVNSSYIYEGISMKLSDIVHYDVKHCLTFFKSKFPIKSYLPLII